MESAGISTLAFAEREVRRIAPKAEILKKEGRNL
jgi:hypothetical protein